MRIKKKFLIGSIMAALDIFIKIIIDTFFMESKLRNAVIGFVPYLNKTQMSIFNREMGLNLDIGMLIVISAAVLVLLALIKVVLVKRNEWRAAYNISEVMLLSGAVCSLIDKIFWGGSLDYILIFNNIIDLKDIYLYAGACVVIGDAFIQILDWFKNLKCKYLLK